MAGVRRALDEALSALLAAQDLWVLVRSAGSKGIVIPDRWSSFTLAPDGLLVFATPDVMLQFGALSLPEIWDFKVGLTDGAIDQIFLYALACSHGFGSDPKPGLANNLLGGSLASPTCELVDSASALDVRYQGRVIALGSSASPDQREAFPVCGAELDVAENRVRASVREMKSFLADPEANIPLELKQFPRTERRWKCAECQFRGICEPEHFPLPIPHCTVERAN
jgi:hypothetical protein